MTALTEREIVDAIERELAEGKSSGASELRSVIRDIASPLTNPAWLSLDADASEWDRSRPDPHDLWIDLRISEARRLRELYQAAIEQAAVDCEATIVSALAAAGVQFAAEYPDAPRPNVEAAA